MCPLEPMQEDALVGLMYEEFGASGNKHLDYDKVRRFAFQLQTDPLICQSMDTEPRGEGECWEPNDTFITEMCKGFVAHARQQMAKERSGAFGGGREVEYDPKNPHARPAGAPRASPPSRGRASARPRSPTARAARAAQMGSPNAFAIAQEA